MPQSKLAVVLDCNIIWQAFFFEHGDSAQCMQLVVAGKINLVLSAEILQEMREVLSRPEAQAKYNVTQEAVDKYLINLANKSVLVRSVPKVFAYPRDPDDEPYVNLAFAAKAEYLVTRDHDLLDLMISHTVEGKDFRQRFRPLKVVEPLTLLDEIKRIEGTVRS
jgi:putative PIN family toxin of toxin-antitoxin system